jgi:Calcineurin-like phosphoesterase
VRRDAASSRLPAARRPALRRRLRSPARGAGSSAGGCGIVAPFVRTLVVSDFHLGARLRRDVLRRAVARDALVGALDGVERLVLLGDVLELLEGRPGRAIEVAEPVLRAIGAHLGSGAEVIVVPGNHDAALVRPWLRRRGVPRGVDAEISADATPMLERVTSWLEPAGVRVHYPGVWLSEDVWATHGHYLDRHLLPESAFGIARGLLGRLPRDGAEPIDYERAGGLSLTRLEALLTRWLPRPLAVIFDDLTELLRAQPCPASLSGCSAGASPH